MVIFLLYYGVDGWEVIRCDFNGVCILIFLFNLLLYCLYKLFILDVGEEKSVEVIILLWNLVGLILWIFWYCFLIFGGSGLVSDGFEWIVEWLNKWEFKVN